MTDHIGICFPDFSFFFLSDFMLIMESNIYHKTHAAP